MSRREEKYTRYLNDLKKYTKDVDEDLLALIVFHLGPAIYRVDAEVVSCSNQDELDRVRNNFLKKKLGLTESEERLNHAIKEVCQTMGSDNRHKYRAVFYYLLTKMYQKESALGKEEVAV
jgi:TPP-dependent pyruvate/acetoin dehydrogenase alpha subunit